MEEKNNLTPLEDWLDGWQLMRRLGISQRTLQDWRSKKKINYSQIGRKFYYRKTDVEAMLDEGYKAEKQIGGQYE